MVQACARARNASEWLGCVTCLLERCRREVGQDTPAARATHAALRCSSCPALVACCAPALPASALAF
eukprot:2382464-Prymnesium_polylepis.1